MSKHKDPLSLALEQGKSFTWTVPEGGNLASMHAAIKHGQTLTLSPIVDPSEIQAGDIVFVKWHQGHLFHMVGDVQGDRYLIVNSLGKANGWVGAKDILGKVTQIIEPEQCPGVPAMLDQLEAAYHNLTGLEHTSQDDAQRLSAIIEDLRWYADRLGMERCSIMPKDNKWSFEQNLWSLTRQAKAANVPVPDRIRYLIDRGKQCVGLASEILALFEYGNLDD
jgi:hypothetical protein